MVSTGIPVAAASAVRQLRDIGFDTILLWGVEHWYMRRERHQDMVWWNQMLLFFPLAATTPSLQASIDGAGALQIGGAVPAVDVGDENVHRAGLHEVVAQQLAVLDGVLARGPVPRRGALTTAPRS